MALLYTQLMYQEKDQESEFRSEDVYEHSDFALSRTIMNHGFGRSLFSFGVPLGKRQRARNFTAKYFKSRVILL